MKLCAGSDSDEAKKKEEDLSSNEALWSGARHRQQFNISLKIVNQLLSGLIMNRWINKRPGSAV